MAPTRRGHMPVRRLVRKAPDVLLAAKHPSGGRAGPSWVDRDSISLGRTTVRGFKGSSPSSGAVINVVALDVGCGTPLPALAELSHGVIWEIRCEHGSSQGRGPRQILLVGRPDIEDVVIGLLPVLKPDTQLEGPIA